MDYETFLELFRKETTPIVIVLLILFFIMLTWSFLIIPYIVDDFQHDSKLRNKKLEDEKISKITENVFSKVTDYYDNSCNCSVNKSTRKKK